MSDSFRSWRHRPTGIIVTVPIATDGLGPTWEPEPSEPPSPSYTLADLKQLGREYSSQCQAKDDSVIAGLVLSQFTRWLEKKEEEANGAQEANDR